MQWWLREYEPLRAEAREMAAKVTASMPISPPFDDRDALVAWQRRLIASRETVVSAGADAEIASVPGRLFRPTVTPRGVYLHLHGGGLIAGSPRMSDEANADLAERLSIVVVSLDYRLAPENPYPAAVDDAFAAAAWLVSHAGAVFGTSRLLIGGESAGAYLSVLALLRLRDAGMTGFLGANLVYAGYDMSRSTPGQSGARVSEVPDILDPDGLRLIGDCFLPGRSDEQRRIPEISPAFAALHDLPPALFTVGSADHLFDDNVLLAARWAAAGSGGELAIYPDCIHGFLRQPTRLARRANERIAEFLDHSLG
ncbi:alpha/beta hydrolase [Kribbella kalugense]|uniref:Acetyl esterase/lipase n=1 Tax=Kribbella kalugense TaxID=2512221 RepID=A0A4R8A140_9ACTN|nr:alpha/beta hydrolase [Kribbella kalugense]TDW24217.1 acetyl esterase/lipase [Kribbella kalugense]